MNASPNAATLERVQVTIPAELADRYRERNPSAPLDEILSEQLTACADVDPNGRSLHFQGKQREELERLVGGRYCRTPAELLRHLRRSLSAVVVPVGEDPVEVPLSPVLTERLKTRTYGRNLSGLIREQVVDALEAFSNLR